MSESATSSRRGWMLPALLAVLALLTAAVCVALIHDRVNTEDPPSALAASDPQVREAVGVARRVGVAYFSLDFRQPRAGVRQVENDVTEQFRERYAAELDGVAATVREQRSVLSAKLVGPGVAVEFADSDRAQLLLALDVTTTGRDGAASTRTYRIRVNLIRPDDAWLVSGLDRVT